MAELSLGLVEAFQFFTPIIFKENTKAINIPKILLVSLKFSLFLESSEVYKCKSKHQISSSKFVPKISHYLLIQI